MGNGGYSEDEITIVYKCHSNVKQRMRLWPGSLCSAEHLHAVSSGDKSDSFRRLGIDKDINNYVRRYIEKSYASVALFPSVRPPGNKAISLLHKMSSVAQAVWNTLPLSSAIFSFRSARGTLFIKDWKNHAIR